MMLLLELLSFYHTMVNTQTGYSHIYNRLCWCSILPQLLSMVLTAETKMSNSSLSNMVHVDSLVSWSSLWSVSQSSATSTDDLYTCTPPHYSNQLEYYEEFGYPDLPVTAGQQYLSPQSPSPCIQAAEKIRLHKQVRCYQSFMSHYLTPSLTTHRHKRKNPASPLRT